MTRFKRTPVRNLPADEQQVLDRLLIKEEGLPSGGQTKTHSVKNLTTADQQTEELKPDKWVLLR